MRPPDHLRLPSGRNLTALHLEDAPALVDGCNHPEVYRNTGSLPYPYGLGDAQAFLDTNHGFEADHRRRKSWAIRQADGQLVGVIGRLYRYGQHDHLDEVGYWVNQRHTHQGIASEALAHYCHYLHTHERLVRIEAHVYTYNPASARVLEKCGFQREGLLRAFALKDGAYLDVWLYGRVQV